MWQFTPTEVAQSETDIPVPDFEDARADFAPYYASILSETEAQVAVSNEIGKLGARAIRFEPGYFTIQKRKRYGYNIRFEVNSQEAIYRVAGLPMRAETEKKIERVRVQALLNVRDRFKSIITSKVFAPGESPLIQYTIVDGQRSLAEVFEEYIQRGQLPTLPSPK